MTDLPEIVQPDAEIAFGRPFVLVRDIDVSGVSGVGVVADGTLFPDGHTVLHWRGQWPTTTPHPSLESVLAVHGHGGATRVVWQPRAIPQPIWSDVWPELVGWVTAASEDSEQIDPEQLRTYLRELRHRALAPTREWMNTVIAQPTDQTGGTQ